MAAADLEPRGRSRLAQPAARLVLAWIDLYHETACTRTERPTPRPIRTAMTRATAFLTADSQPLFSRAPGVATLWRRAFGDRDYAGLRAAYLGAANAGTLKRDLISATFSAVSVISSSLVTDHTTSPVPTFSPAEWLAREPRAALYFSP